MEAEVGALLAELDPCVYCLDCFEMVAQYIARGDPDHLGVINYQ